MRVKANLVVASLFAIAVPGCVHGQAAPPPKRDTTVSEVVVTASRADLIGKAVTASQGTVTRKEVELRPIYRIGQLYETVPGLVVTVHSGEGKANQYLLRGFNLDHGTDFASFIDAMPVNRPTNTHGQGYSDQNYLMPQLVGGIDYTKGPYYAAIGDFGAVGSAHVRLVDDLPSQVALSAGTLRDSDAFVALSQSLGADDRVWAAADLGHYDGPWSPAGNFNKINATGRFSHGTDGDGYSLTAMYYDSKGGLETDQPLRAYQQGLIGRYGVLDPTDASRSERYSLSGHYGATGDHWTLTANAYAIHSTMTLWNDFTHVLDDEVNGDQEQQDETRDTFGGDVAFTYKATPLGVPSDTTVGLQERYDGLYIDRRHTLRRVALDYCDIEGFTPNNLALPADAPASPAGDPATPFAAVHDACNADRVHLNDLGVYIQNSTRWTGWLRTEIGLRDDDYAARDQSLTTAFTGTGSQTLLQPKGSLILGPWWKTELYVSAGRGFHSDDVRGVFGTVPLEGIPTAAGRTPLLSPTTGEEIGLRSDILPRVQLEVAVFQEAFNSELAYDADAGEDTASAPSRRQGIEVSGQYHPASWIEFNADLAFSKARYRGSSAELNNDFGLGGNFIANAPSFIGAFGVLVDNLGPWFGGLQWRDLGPYPVSDGEQDPRDKGYSEVNVDAGYKFGAKLKLQASIYNLTNSKADAAAYYYVSRLPGEPAVGVSGLQVHPLEPISARLTVTALF